MTSITRAERGRDRWAARARCAAAGLALGLLPAAAGAFTLINVTGGTVNVSVYDQNDTAVAVPCFEISMGDSQALTYPAPPGICAGYAKLKVKGVGSRGPLFPGGTCWGENVLPAGSARITGTVDACRIIVLTQP